jgi:hypothetical protein
VTNIERAVLDKAVQAELERNPPPVLSPADAASVRLLLGLEPEQAPPPESSTAGSDRGVRLPPEAYEAARRNAEAAPVTDRLIEDLQAIIWDTPALPDLLHHEESTPWRSR